MGLDMYLDKAKRINGATARDISNAENYLDWLLRPSKYKDSTLKSWCGIDESEIDMDVVDDYRREYKTCYSYWDDEKKYGHLGLWDGVGYWRKANQIHNWFVDNVQGGVDDCGTYEVSKENLEDLLWTCKRVKRHSNLVDGKIVNGQKYENGEWVDIVQDGKYIEDPSVAETLLPTTSGFFFGGTEYDQWYMDDIENTIRIINWVLQSTDFENEIVTYSASW